MIPLAIQDNWQALATIAAIVLIAYLLVMWIAALVWTYRDIAARTGDAFTQAMSLGMVVLFNLPGLLLYVILRPKDTMAEIYDRRLEAEALLHEIQEQATCPTCRRKVEDDFLVCPYCRSTLRTACESCGRPASSSWVVCPYCGAERSAPAPRPVGSAQTEPPMEPMAAPARRASTARYTPPAAAKPPE